MHLEALSVLFVKVHWSALHLEGVFFNPGTIVWKYWLTEL